MFYTWRYCIGVGDVNSKDDIIYFWEVVILEGKR